MKELLTKTFWQDIKRTFDEARAETIPTSGDTQAASPVEVKSDIDPSQVPSAPEAAHAIEPSVELNTPKR